MGDIKFIANIKKEDYKTVALYNSFIRKKIVTGLSIALFVGGLLCLFLLDLAIINRIINIIFMLYPILLIRKQLKSINKMLEEKDIPETQQNLTIVSEDRGITSKLDGDMLTFSWSEIKEVREIKDFFIVYTIIDRLIYMPKADIDPNDLDRIRNIVRNKLPYKSYRLKK